MADSSESPHRNGFSQIFSKDRKHRKNRDSASTSIKSGDTESDGHHSMRESLESAIEKLKQHAEDDDNQGIKKLVPNLGTKRRRKKREQEEEQRAMEEAARGRSVADRGTLENFSTDRRPSISRTHSGRSGNGSSLITYDSETES